jgi:uncharacterized protein
MARRWFLKKRIWALLLLLMPVIFLGKGYWNATRDPLIRKASVNVNDWPLNTPAVKILLISDTHVAGPDMPPERLAGILCTLNSHKPDVILLAGDYISEKRLATRLYTPAELAKPFVELSAPMGVFAVMGNHDHWADVDAIRVELQRNGVRVLDNNAARAGPIIIGGIDDEFTNHHNLVDTYAAMDSLGAGPRILLSHGPDVVPDLPKPVEALFTGHTHCGQIVLPFIGAIAQGSRYGERFSCGDITDKRQNRPDQRLFVSAGLGTSILPLRYGAHPDVWLVTLGRNP